MNTNEEIEIEGTPVGAAEHSDQPKKWTPEYVRSLMSRSQLVDSPSFDSVICAAHNAALVAEREQGNFARVQEQAKQLSELREAIMGGTGTKAVATHEQLLEKVVAERQRREQAEHQILNREQRWEEIERLYDYGLAQQVQLREQLLSALAAIEKFKAYLELYFLKGVLRFDDGKDYRQVARELIDVSPDLSLLHQHDAELWRLLIDDRPRAICLNCGYPELIGSDDCRGCGINFAKRIEFGEAHDDEVRKPLVVLLREARAYFRGNLTARMVEDMIIKIDAALAQCKEKQ